MDLHNTKRVSEVYPLGQFDNQEKVRHRAPDLLFEDEQEERIRDITGWLCKPSHARPNLLHRVTVFLTYRCNLACTYCKTIVRTSEEYHVHPHKRFSLSLNALEQTFSRHFRPEKARVLHVHFTGGEALVDRELPAMVAMVKSRGVQCVSVTTNGTLPTELLLQAIAHGLDEVRVSIDSAEPIHAEQISQRKHSFARQLDTLRALQQLKKHHSFYWIINMVIGPHNRRDLLRLLRFAATFEPDDIKLITEVDARDSLPLFDEQDALLSEALGWLDEQEARTVRYPLLRRKLHTVFDAESIGLESIAHTIKSPFRCYIPLTERTFDATFYYPCSVYLRENGEPLGRLDDDDEIQREKTANFVETSDCMQDPICLKYCLRCTRDFNVRANRVKSEA